MTNWQESQHPRDDEGKFTYKNGGSSSSSSADKEREKLQNRADILFPNTVDNSYFRNRKETDVFKRYDNIQQETLKQNIQEKAIELEITKNNNAKNNAKFSDSALARAREFIQGSEGYSAEAYRPNDNDVLTIGYGHTGKVDGKPIVPGMRITKEKAEELYRKDFEFHTAPLKEVKVPLTDNQKIALASFIYNLGPTGFANSSVCKKLNQGDYAGAANAFDKYIKQRNKKTGDLEVLQGLVNRRAKEKKLFLTPDGE